MEPAQSLSRYWSVAAAAMCCMAGGLIASQPRGLPGCPDVRNDWVNCHIVALSATGAVSGTAPGMLRTIDNVTSTAAHPTRLCWVGRYEGGVDPAVIDESFRIRIFRDSMGLPNRIDGPIFERVFRLGGAAGVDLLEMSCLSGQPCPGSAVPGSGGHWVYSAEVAGGLPLTANGCYWFEIACAGSAGAGLSWEWSASLAGTELISLQAADGAYTPFSRVSNDRALCLSGGVDPFVGNCIVPSPPPPCFFFDSANGQAHDGVTTVGRVSSSPGSPQDANFVPVQWADNFRLAAAGEVSGICFRGFWRCGFNYDGDCAPPTAPRFDVAYFEDGGGLPGQMIATFRVGSEGVSVSWTLDEASVWHPGVELQGGRCYWVSVSRLQRFEVEAYDVWSWMQTTSDIGDGIVAARTDGVWQRRVLAAGGSAAASNFSFVLNAGPLVPADCIPGDCNANGIPDVDEIATDPSLDCYTAGGPAGTMGGPDAVLDACQCRADWNRDDVVNSTDISAFLTSWLIDVAEASAHADINCSGATDSNDISRFLTLWLESVAGNGPTGCP